jgi:hypothetical protein
LSVEPEQIGLLLEIKEKTGMHEVTEPPEILIFPDEGFFRYRMPAEDPATSA